MFSTTLHVLLQLVKPCMTAWWRGFRSRPNALAASEVEWVTGASPACSVDSILASWAITIVVIISCGLSIAFVIVVCYLTNQITQNINNTTNLFHSYITYSITELLVVCTYKPQWRPTALYQSPLVYTNRTYWDEVVVWCVKTVDLITSTVSMSDWRPVHSAPPVHDEDQQPCTSHPWFVPTELEMKLLFAVSRQ